jgi:hypothetical protein
MSLKYTVHVVLTLLSHYGTFVFIISICYLTPSLTILHPSRGVGISI